MAKFASISCDLDEIYNYCAIHAMALSELPASSAHLVYEVAIPRLHAWASELGIPLTLYAVGADLRRPAASQRLREMHGAGHEIGNHSFSHRYDFSRLPPEDMEAEVARAQTVIAEAVGEAPSGFRAPGYIVNDKVTDVLVRQGFTYDSSVFPSLPYYSAKAGVMGLMRLRGRTSRSIMGAPDVLLAPREPYRMGRHYTERGSGLIELPVQTLPWSGLPLIGTALTMAGPKRAAWMTRQCTGKSFVNLELHGVDLLEAADGLEGLASRQRDLQIPLRRKLETLTAVAQELRDSGYRFVTMREAASQLFAV